MMKKTTITIFIILLVAAAVAIFVWPSFEKLKISKANLADKEKQVKDLQEYISQINGLTNQIKGSADQISKIDQALLDSSYLPTVFQLIQTASSSTGARINKIQLGKEVPSRDSQNVIAQEVNLTIAGDYPSMKKFLMFLEDNARLLYIDEVRLMTSSILSDKKISPTMDIKFEVLSYLAK